MPRLAAWDSFLSSLSFYWFSGVFEAMRPATTSLGATAKAWRLSSVRAAFGVAGDSLLPARSPMQVAVLPQLRLSSYTPVASGARSGAS
jgi:hypothetical protein